MPDCAAAHRGHEGVENTDSEGGAACEWLGEVELSVGVIVIILDQSEVSITVTWQLWTNHSSPGPGTGHCCHSPARWSSGHWSRTRNPSSAELWGSQEVREHREQLNLECIKYNDLQLYIWKYWKLSNILLMWMYFCGGFTFCYICRFILREKDYE